MAHRSVPRPTGRRRAIAFYRDIYGYPRAAAAAVNEFITGPLVREPYRVGKQLMPPLDDRYSARRGTYRIIYRIDDASRTVTVVDVDHRGDMYHR